MMFANMITLLTQMLPFGSSVLFSAVYFVFTVCLFISIILSVIHIVNEVKELFKIV